MGETLCDADLLEPWALIPVDRAVGSEMVEVSRLIDPDMLVEIEVEAIVE